MTIRGTSAIVGAAQLDTVTMQGKSPVGLMAIAVNRALADAGLTLADVDALFTASSYYAFPSLTLAEYLGIHPRHTDSTALGGCSFIAQLGHAAAAIQAGLCDVAVIAYGSTQRSDAGKLVSMAESSAYEQPYGLIHPIGAFGMIAQRHMAQYGTTSEQLAQYAVSARQWSLLTDTAPYPTPLTVDDVLNSGVISSPLHKLDCCLVTDGAAAVVLVSAERARDLRSNPVYLLGSGEAVNHRNVSQMPDLTATEAARSGPCRWRVSRLMRSIPPTCTTPSPSVCSYCSKISDSAPRVKAGPSSRTAIWPRAAGWRSIRTAPGCRKCILACSACS